jgi:hypothetical protein
VNWGFEASGSDDPVATGGSRTYPEQVRAWVYWSDGTVTSSTVDISPTFPDGITVNEWNELSSRASSAASQTIYDAIDGLIGDGPQMVPPGATAADPVPVDRSGPVWQGPPASSWDGRRPPGAPPAGPDPDDPLGQPEASPPEPGTDATSGGTELGQPR